MRCVTFSTALFLMALIALAPMAMADEVPGRINYQGWLTDPSGNPLHGNYGMAFSIWNNYSDGDSLWGESQSVAVDSGFFNVQLGYSNGLDHSLFGDTARWLQVRIGTETWPRTALLTVAYAHVAENGGGWTQDQNVEKPIGGVTFGDNSQTIPETKLKMIGYNDTDIPFIRVEQQSDYPQDLLNPVFQIYSIAYDTVLFEILCNGAIRIRDTLTGDKDRTAHKVITYIGRETTFFLSEQVGIGNENPSCALDVVGRVKCDSLTVGFDYVSPWTRLSAGAADTIEHSVGGDPERYMVIIDGKSDHGDGIHQANLGTNYQYLIGWLGLEWYDLNSNSIKIARGVADDRGNPRDWDEYRIRIIKNQ